MEYSKDRLMGRLSEGCLERLSKNWSEMFCEAGREILSEKDNGREVYFVLSGSVRITIYTARGREVSFTDLMEGEIFGEFSAIDGQPRSANVVAVNPCRVARMSAEQFNHALLSEPDLSMAVIESLVARMRYLTGRVAEFTSLTSPQRVRAEILRLAESNHSDKDMIVVRNPPNQTVLANHLFCNREAVAREMAQMIKDGVLERRPRALVIPSFDALKAYVEERLG